MFHIIHARGVELLQSVRGLRYGLDDREVIFGIPAGQDIVVVCKAFKLALQIIQPSSQRVPVSAYVGVRYPGV